MKCLIILILLEVIVIINWQFKKNDNRRSYEALPSGVYRVQIERAEEAVSASGNQMIQMVLRVLGYSNRVRHYLTFSPKNRFIVNKALGDIYSSFDIAEGNLNAKTWVGHIGMAKLETDEFNGRAYNRVGYFLIKPQQLKLGILAEEADEAFVEEDDEEYYSSRSPSRESSFECLYY